MMVEIGSRPFERLEKKIGLLFRATVFLNIAIEYKIKEGVE